MKRSPSLYLILLILVSVIAFTGCNSEKEFPDDSVDSPIQLIWEDAPEHTAAILINRPTDEQLTDFAPSERLVLERSDEGFLLIPVEEIEEIVIWELEFDGSDFIRTETVYENFDPGDEFVLELVVMRPEGGPHFELSLISDKGESTYYIAYDGRDGNPNIEYIESE